MKLIKFLKTKVTPDTILENFLFMVVSLIISLIFISINNTVIKVLGGFSLFAGIIFFISIIFLSIAYVIKSIIKWIKKIFGYLTADKLEVKIKF